MHSKKSSDDDSEYKPSTESQEQIWNSSDEDVFKSKKPMPKQSRLQKTTSSRKSYPGGNAKLKKATENPTQSSRASQQNPVKNRKNKQNKSENVEGVLKSEHTQSTQCMGFCPICQAPFNILKISPITHTASCELTENAPVCPDGSKCLNATIFHYRDFSHEALANLRASEDYVEPDVVFTPQKLKRTPLKRSSGKKRPSQTPLTSKSKLKKTEEEPCCSKDLLESSPTEKDVTKKKLFYDESMSNIKPKCDSEEEEKHPPVEEKQIDFNGISDSEQNSLPDTLVESEFWCSDLLLGGSMPQEDNVPDPLNSMVPAAASVEIKNEPLSQNSANESTPVSNARVCINYENMLSDRDTEEQSVTGCNIDCSESCTGIAVDTLEVNCSLSIKAHGQSRDEAMSRSPLSVTLMVNRSGWEAVDVKGTESVDIQKIVVSLCECSHTVCVECCVTNKDCLNDVKFNPMKTELCDKFFSTMTDLNIKKKNHFVEPLQYSLAARKELLERTCNKITVSSLEVYDVHSPRVEEPIVSAVPSIDETLQVTSPRIEESAASAASRTDKEPQQVIKVVDAFSLLKKSTSNAQRSVTPPIPTKPSFKKTQTSLPMPMVVSGTTGSSWTLEQVSYRGRPPTTGSKKVPAYKRIPGTQIVVDAFNYGIIPGVKAYFLSHFHSDHYNGLRKGFNMPIFCSQVTANLVHLKLRVDQEHLHILKIGEPRTVCGVEVEIFEANHCPGAIMFLFRILDGQTYLHVGDFRAHESMEVYPQLRFVDKLFLDTTYCDPAYDFPSQEEVVSKVVKTVSEHLTRNKATLIVCGTYTIGKEKVFMGIAETFNMKVYTSTEKRKVYNCLEDRALSSRLTTDATSAQIHVMAMKDIASEELLNYLNKYSPKYTHVLAFKPTGWTTSNSLKSKPSDFTMTSRGKVTIYGVPYSEHSSFSELRQFVRHIRPKDIQVTVNLGKSSQYKKLFQQWLTSNRSDNGQSKMVQYFSSSSTEPSR